MAQAQPALAEQLKSVSRAVLSLHTSVVSMCDVIEAQAAEIERLRNEVAQCQTCTVKTEVPDEPTV